MVRTAQVVHVLVLVAAQLRGEGDHVHLKLRQLLQGRVLGVAHVGDGVLELDDLLLGGRKKRY